MGTFSHLGVKTIIYFVSLEWEIACCKSSLRTGKNTNYFLRIWCVHVIKTRDWKFFLLSNNKIVSQIVFNHRGITLYWLQDIWWIKVVFKGNWLLGISGTELNRGEWSSETRECYSQWENSTVQYSTVQDCQYCNNQLLVRQTTLNSDECRTHCTAVHLLSPTLFSPWAPQYKLKVL